MKALKATSQLTVLSAAIVSILTIVPARANGHSFIGPLNKLSAVASTVPGNGDINPYGVAVVPQTIGNLTQGDILVSNFNKSSNVQGTGSTIVQITPAGGVSLFAQINLGIRQNCPGGVGLTTALAVLERGWVIVGSLPTSNGMSATAQAGCLIVLDSMGKPVETFSGSPINGPWDMTALDQGTRASLFVTNVLNGGVATANPPHVVNKGTVVRIEISVPKAGEGMPMIHSTQIIGSGFAEIADPNALIIGPTGVGLGKDGTLYVADSESNRIAAIPNALDRITTAYAGKDVSANGKLNGPLGLAIAPNGDVLTVNAGDGNLVETTPEGVQIATKTITTNPPGSLFGLAVTPSATGVYFVDDTNNNLNLLSDPSNPPPY